jgi:hypothetical protein
MYEITCGKTATHAAEYTKLLVKNLNDVLKAFEKRGYSQYHIRDTGYSEIHEKRVLYLIKDDQKSMISVMIQEKNITQAKLNDVYWDMDDDKEFDGRRFNFVSIQTSNYKEYLWFKKLITDLRIVEDTKNKLFMMKSTEYSGIELDSFPMDNVVCDIEMNYGSNFTHVHEKVVENLKDKKSGLYIFHGPPGTGKTSYIKYLTTVVQNRRFILVPNTMVASIFSPKMVQNIYTFKDSVLILEDAELCVFKRDGNNNELVSGILNITDGMLKDLLNISIFVTFNSSKIDELDKALLRKGRLKTIYKFDALSKEDSQKLLVKLGKTQIAEGPMTLADIYNIDEETDMGGEIVPNTEKVGFGFGAR